MKCRLSYKFLRSANPNKVLSNIFKDGTFFQKKNYVPMAIRCIFTSTRKTTNTIDGVAKFEAVVLTVELEKTIGLKDQNCRTQKSSCLFILGQRVWQVSNIAKKNWEWIIIHNTTVDFANYLREVCAEELLQNPKKLVVTDYLSKLTRALFPEENTEPVQWVFGGVCRETKDVFLIAVSDRGSETLMGCIEQFVEKNSLIMSHCWSSHKCLKDHPNYRHMDVNHSKNFVDPVTGAHTQSVESMWRDAKMQNKKMCGTHRSLIDSYLCEFLWRKRHPKDTFEAIMFAIANFWNK